MRVAKCVFLAWAMLIVASWLTGCATIVGPVCMDVGLVCTQDETPSGRECRRRQMASEQCLRDLERAREMGVRR